MRDHIRFLLGCAFWHPAVMASSCVDGMSTPRRCRRTGSLRTPMITPHLLRAPDVPSRNLNVQHISYCRLAGNLLGRARRFPARRIGEVHPCAAWPNSLDPNLTHRSTLLRVVTPLRLGSWIRRLAATGTATEPDPGGPGLGCAPKRGLLPNWSAKAHEQPHFTMRAGRSGSSVARQPIGSGETTGMNDGNLADATV